MDLGCKLIRGERAPGRALVPAPVFPPGSLYRDFSTFLFLASEGRAGEGGGGQRRAGGMVCRLVCPSGPPLMLSQCFFSLSLELVLRYQPSTLARPMPGGRARRQAAPPASAHGGGTSASRRPLAAPQTLVASPPGPQFLGRGEPRRDCALPSAPEPRSRRRRRRTEDSGGHRGTSPAGPPRLQLY
ncbi:unnamed protein product [Rangifer tarandus platyrhynchus]|uniref:Uncharacterized protein n=2 Tax=Rangifer tarandus platyrhynchus TaxID=3082113 RepID=A0AC59YSY0_RANTA|nr:unnamed protein product [Rangifer tarandus platyrhynchus]